MCIKPTEQFDVPKDHLSNLRAKSRSATKNCCECVYREDGVHPSTWKIKQLAADGVTENGHKDNQWKAEIIIDGSVPNKGMVYVSTRMKAINQTGNTALYPDTVYISDEELNKRVKKIPSAIRTAWNSRKYKIKIVDKKCGERIFEVNFNPILVNDDTHHYTINFVNVSMKSLAEEPKKPQSNIAMFSNRSYVSPSIFSSKFNLNDSRTASDSWGGEMLEPHEYGHMLGLIDEYKYIPRNRNGIKYTYYNNKTETFSVNGELMGSMHIHTAQPERYCLTIAYTVVRILEKNGCKVTNMEIIGSEGKK